MRTTSTTDHASRPPEGWTRVFDKRPFLPVSLSALGGLWLIGESFGYSYSHALSASLIVLLYAWGMFRSAPLTFFLSTTFIASLLPVVASNLYLEAGNYITEQGRYGEVTGATVRLSFLTVAYLAGIQLVISSLTRTRAPDRRALKVDTFSTWAWRFHAAVLAGMVTVLAVYGAPLLQGIDRFQFWEQTTPYLDRLPYLCSVAIFVSTVAFALDPKRGRFPYLILIALSITLLVLLSEKFTALFSAMALGLTAAYSVRVRLFAQRPRATRFALLAIVGASGLLIAVANGYMLFYGYDSSSVASKIIDRAFGLQGHVWFGIDRNLSRYNASGEASLLLQDTSLSRPAGLDLLMYEVAPPQFVDIMRSRGQRFTMGNPAIAVFALGYGWAVVYQLAAGAFTGLVLRYLLLGIETLSIARIVLALVAVRALSNAFLMGYPAELWDPLALAGWACIVGDIVARSRPRRRPSRPYQLLLGGRG